MGRINQNWLKRRKQKPAATPAQAEQPTHVLLESPAVAEQQKVVSDESSTNAPLKSSAGTEPQNVVFDEKPADALLKSVNDTAGNARNLFVTYILLSVYIFLTVGATNDEQLLRDDSVAVPFLENINLPVSRFYQCVPWMFLFVHADLLLLFKLMADKLHAFNETINKPEFDRKEAAELRQQLSGLPFVHWLAGDQNDGFSHRITGLIVWSSLLVLPLLTLLALQIGFLPYHSTLTTFAHRLALGLDALALLWFWPRLAAGMTEWTLLWWLPFWFIRLFKILIASRIIQSVLHSKKAVNQWIALMVRKARHGRNQVLNAHPKPVEIQQRSFLKSIEHPTACRGICRTASILLLVGSVWFGGLVLVLPGEKLENDGLITHWLLDDVEKNKPSDDEIQQASLRPWHDQRRIRIELRNNDWFADAVLAHLPLLHRNLDLHEKLLVANEPSLEILAKLQDWKLKPEDRENELIHIKGLGLQNRDLRFAKLRLVKLWRADLRGAHLQKADLSAAQLQGITWGGKAQLQDTNLDFAFLQGADLEEAQLIGASLVGTQLQDTNLFRADLSDVELQFANLHGANLEKALFRGSILDYTQLQGANLGQANLKGTYLECAQMQGANLMNAELEGAYLGRAQLQGANLRLARLQGANFVNANLRGADLNEAQVGSASFKKVVFGLNDFRGMSTSPLFDSKALEFWKTHIRESMVITSLRGSKPHKLYENNITLHYSPKKREDWLQEHANKSTEFQERAISAPCLADVSHIAMLQGCRKSNQSYFKVLADYLGDLSCRVNNEVFDSFEIKEKPTELYDESKGYIAKGIGNRILDPHEWGLEGATARRQLAHRLLQNDCAGKAGLDDNLRAFLRNIVKAPEASAYIYRPD
jgi:uncharacterized protein YjbI with pentapeptide repeats